MIPFALTIFLSAFLLFEVQPLIGKYILPWFGGTPAVWTTCMLFFQSVLLGGYAYAHLTGRRLSSRSRPLVHLALLALSLAVLPILPSTAWKPTGSELPTWRILALLAASVGVPYFLLSTTGPLLQDWFARGHPGRSPYRLYALSNAGSLLALVSYPFLVEPLVSLRTQGLAWSWSYAAFVVLCGWSAVGVLRARPQAAVDVPGAGDPPPDPVDAPTADEAAPPKRSVVLLWLALPAAASVMLLATTSQMCLDLTVIPFLWVLPLALYLLSFIICFYHSGGYVRVVFGPLLAVTAAGACGLIYYNVKLAPVLPLQIAGYSAALFACCMVCHGELVRLKPAPRHLTLFYLMVSAGGALGGVFVVLVATHLFRGYWEYHLGLGGTCLLALVALFRDRSGRLYHGRPVWAWVILLAAFLAVSAALIALVGQEGRGVLARSRNFYGVLRVTERGYDEGRTRTLMHGGIKHGCQFRDVAKRRLPTSYYGPKSGIGLVLTHHPRRSAADGAARTLRIGVVGLGTGTLAAYGRPGDTIRFYEINPEVVRLSDEYFTYRRDTPARVDVVLGDARVSMEQEIERGEPQAFDVLAVDAFSSDAIPMHLLTRECAGVYWRHLKPDGVLAIHISNHYLDLAPVVRGLAREFARDAVRVSSGDDDDVGVDSATWVLVTRNRGVLDLPVLKDAVEAWSENDPPPLVWTDDYGSLFQVLQ